MNSALFLLLLNLVQGAEVTSSNFHMSSSELAGLGIIFIAGIFAFATGVGGGGIYVPVLILIFSYTAKEAVPCSKAIIFGGAFVSFFLNIKKRTLDTDEPVIDYQTAAVLQPIILLGTVFGVYANVFLPELIILILLCVLLIVVTYKSGKKAINLYKKETEKMASTAKAEADHVEEHEILVQTDKKHNRFCISTAVLNFLAIALFSLLKGGKAFDSIIGIQPCSLSYFALVASFVLYSLLSCAMVYKKVNEDLRWKSSACVKYCSIALIGGIGSGLLGIGGGLIISPMLLGIGFQPQIAAATSSYLVMFTSASTSLQYTLIGVLDIVNASIFILTSVSAAFFGIKIVHSLIVKYKRPSIVVIALTLMMAVVSVLMPVFKFMTIDTSHMEFHSIC